MTRRRGNTQTGEYDHLNDGLLTLPVCMDTLVKIVAKKNYGIHRLLSAVVRYRLHEDADDPLGNMVKSILDEGWY